MIGSHPRDQRPQDVLLGRSHNWHPQHGRSRPFVCPVVWCGAFLFLWFCLPACSIRKLAVAKLGDAISGAGTTVASDDDPELIRASIPFTLKLMESLLAEMPKRQPLLLAASSGFTQYSYAFIQQDADFLEANDLAAATALRTRARKLYLRALDYGFRGLEVDLPDFRAQLRKNPQEATSKLRKKHVPLLYWTAMAWGAAISISKDDPELTADQNQMEALMRRALALDESWDYGSIHDFFISYEGGRTSVGGSLAKAREHFERAKTLSEGRRIAPLVIYAETVSISTQNRKEFQSLLEEALAFNVNQTPTTRLQNLITQQRARWLLSRADEFFVE
jgi:hypothetical protein